jgi:ABC-type uncharacterized transport system substrate-binding protein
VIKIHSAQGDMMALGTVMDAVAAQKPDLIIVFSSPTLQRAVKRLSAFPIVFTYVADPVAAGAGTSLDRHLPNITGAFTRCDYQGMITLVKTLFPRARKIGTLYTPAEINSVYHMEHLSLAARAQGLELVTVGVNSTNEVSDGTAALCAKGIDVMTQILDNLTDASFMAIINSAKARRMPVLAFAANQVGKGAVAAMARDFEQGGVVAGGIAARVLRGEKPERIPFMPVDKSDLIINLSAARTMGVDVPPSLLKRAVKVLGP